MYWLERLLWRGYTATLETMRFIGQGGLDAPVIVVAVSLSPGVEQLGYYHEGAQCFLIVDVVGFSKKNFVVDCIESFCKV